MKALFACVLIALAPIQIAAAPAVDHWSTPLAPEDAARFEDAKAMIKAEKFASALPMLKALALDLPANADVANLLGFAYRKTGDLLRAEATYIRALYLNPDHLGALEYQGELFLTLGHPEAAKANLARLQFLCPSPCAQTDALAGSIASWAAQKTD